MSEGILNGAASRDAGEQGTRIADRLAERLGPARCERFFGSRPSVRVSATGLEIPVPSGFLAALLDRQIREIVMEAAQEATGETPTGLRFIVAEREEGAPVPVAAAAPQASRPAPVIRSERMARPLSRHGAALPQYNLAHFVVGPSNRLAYEAGLRLCSLSADGTRRAGELLILHGPCGVGKTHLLHGIGLRRQQLGGGARVISGEAFVSEYITSVRSGRIDAWRRQTRSLDLLCLDDVSALVGKPSTQQELVYTLDALAARGAAICVSSPVLPRQIKGLSEALVSRLLSGMVVGIEPPDVTSREQMVRGAARRRGLELDDHAASTLARCMPSGSSVRELEGLVMKVEAIHRLLGASGEAGSSIPSGLVGRATIEQALHHSGRGASGNGTAQPIGSSLSRSAARPPVRFQAILAAVCAVIGVSEGEVLSSGRHALVVLARALCVHTARETTSMSFPEIARALSRPNHSTVITAHQRIARQLKENMPVCLGPGRGEAFLEELAQRVRTTVQAG